MRQKSEAFEKFKKFRVEFEEQLGKYIKIIWSNWGGEFLFGDYEDYLS
jgi:hypothetical protein